MRGTVSIESQYHCKGLRLKSPCVLHERWMRWRRVWFQRNLWDKFVDWIRVHLQCTLVKFPSPTRFRIFLRHEFEALYKIPHIIKLIDGSHISVIAPVIERRLLIIVNNPIIQFHYKRFCWHETMYFGFTNVDGMLHAWLDIILIDQNLKKIA